MQKITTLCLCVVFVLINIGHQALSQTIPPAVQAQMTQELAKRGLTEEEVKTRLIQKGIDVNNINENNILQFQSTLEQVINELELEKRGITPKPSVSIQDTTKTDDSTSTKRQPARVKIPEADSVVDSLQIFGQHIFKDAHAFTTSAEVRPPDTYLLGSGDQLAVNIWGASQFNEKLTVNDDGYVAPYRLPRLYLRGLSLSKARELLRQRYQAGFVFNTNEIDIYLSSPRTITVNVVGEVEKYGSYTLPAINTAFNALLAGGGPTSIGSVRQIKVIRSGQKEKILDVYAFLFNPVLKEDYFLQDNDFIYVPVADKVVTVTGAIKRPFRYELLPSENLLKLIEYAGGASANAFLKNTQIKRFVDDREVILDVDLKTLMASKQDFDLLPGDVITIPSIVTKAENIVRIEGALSQPGQYELTPGMRISDLLSKGILKRDARTDLGFLLRTNPDSTVNYYSINFDQVLNNSQPDLNLLLQPGDYLLVFAQSDYSDRSVVAVDGSVRFPDVYNYNRGLRVYDLINLSGGLITDASPLAFVYRRDPAKASQLEYQRINLQAIMQDTTHADNLRLYPYDSVFVFSVEYFTDLANVKVMGSVRKPGTYPYDQSLTLKDLILQAGGIKMEGAFNRIDLSRIQIDKNQPTKTIIISLTLDENYNIIEGGQNPFTLLPFDHVYVRSVPDFKLQETVNIAGEVLYPGDYALINPNERISSIIQRAGGLTAGAFPRGATVYRQFNNIGFVVIRLDQALTDRNASDNIVLKPGDIIEIPKINEIVSIQGAVNFNESYTDKILNTGKISLAFQGRKSAKWYINNFAAGVSKQGMRRKVTVELVNGQVKKTKNYGLVKAYPKVEAGSTINVAYKPPKPEKIEHEPIDWEKVVANSLSGLTGILTLYLLIQRL